jgi:predicted nucleic acid-binding protein
MRMVFDSSTLILLAKSELLENISEEIQILIPKVVKKECTIKDIFDARLISALIDKNKIKVVTADRKTVKRLCSDFKIHVGEAESLSVALKEKIPIAVDDLPTIKACKILSIPFTTAIHFLIELTKKGKIDKEIALIKLEKLSLYGRYNKRIINNAEKRLKGG